MAQPIAQDVQPRPLTLILPVKPGMYLQLAETLGANAQSAGAAIQKFNTIHYMRTLLLDRSSPNLQLGQQPNVDTIVLVIITEYDGSFAQYLTSFAEDLANFYNSVLPFIIGGDAVVPVSSENPQPFIDFVQANDATNVSNRPMYQAPMYAAYPYTVVEIQAAFPPPTTGS